jgi:hypothetical protein
VSVRRSRRPVSWALSTRFSSIKWVINLLLVTLEPAGQHGNQQG